MFFCCAFKNTGICSVLCISGPKSIGIYSIFCVFAWLPQKTVKRKNAVIYSILWLSKSWKLSEKGVKTALFSDFRYPPNRGGECSWRRLWATRIPSKKLSPTLLKDFWCFSGPGVGGSAVWGAPHHRALVALGTLVTHLSAYSWGAGGAEFKRLRATAGQGPNYVGPLCGYVGLCWRMVAYLAGNVGPSCGYVGLCWPHVDPCWAKRSEKWEQQKKHCKTQDILMAGGLSWGYVGPSSWGYVGPSWGYVGPSWGHVGPSWGYVGPSWSYVGPSWGYVGPSWGYVGPSWGLCWPILRPILAHVEPS